MESDLIAQLKKLTCTDEGECVDPTNNRFSCYYDEETSKMVCGVDLVKKKKTSSKPKTLHPIVVPTMYVSKIDSKGFFTLTFSESMNFTSLISEEKSTIGGVGSRNTGTNSGN